MKTVLAGLVGICCVAVCSGADSAVIPDGKVILLPERKAKVFFGDANRAEELNAPSNYSQWEYARANIGYYSNFIDMWIINYQSKEPAKEVLKKLSNALTNKDFFLELTMEHKVNDGANGVNNMATDARSINQLKEAGFNVEYISLNYMMSPHSNDPDECKARIDYLRKYGLPKDESRPVFACFGPWGSGDLVKSDAKVTETVRQTISWADGAQTDGPLGYWVVDQGKYRNNSYSAVYHAAQQKKESAIMLAPYSPLEQGKTDHIYLAKRDFLKVSKECVLSHEDNLAAPDIWTIWGYGQQGTPALPESKLIDGKPAPVCSMTGVAFWLHYHLFGFPTLKVDPKEVAMGDGERVISLEKGETKSFTVEIANGNNPHIELSPVIRAVVGEGASGWNIVFKLKGKDVTEQIRYKGGVNCIKDLRVSGKNPLKLEVEVTATSDVKANTKLSFEVMSNLSNTLNKKERLPIYLQRN